MPQGFSPRGLAETFTPRRPERNPLALFMQALQADPVGAGMASPLAGPALLGALFKDPVLARAFARFAGMELGGTSGLPAAGEEMLRQHEFLAKLFQKVGLQAGPGTTFGSNFMNSLMGQTFGKNITPWSGAAHQIPRQAMSEEALFAALLSGFTP